MPYIYRYINDNNKVKYVGIIKSDSNFPTRFYQHKKDYWYSTSKEWRIEYSYYSSRSDVEILEAHLISLYSERGEELFNVAKVGWGVSEFIDGDSLEWKRFETPVHLENKGMNTWRKTSDYIELGACFKLARFFARKTELLASGMKCFPGKSKCAKKLMKINDALIICDGDLGLEDKMFDEIDRDWRDNGNLFSVFYHGFEMNDNPIADIQIAKTVELLHEAIFEISDYMESREIRKQ